MIRVDGGRRGGAGRLSTDATCVTLAGAARAFLRRIRAERGRLAVCARRCAAALCLDAAGEALLDPERARPPASLCCGMSWLVASALWRALTQQTAVTEGFWGLSRYLLLDGGWWCQEAAVRVSRASACRLVGARFYLLVHSVSLRETFPSISTY